MSLQAVMRQEESGAKHSEGLVILTGRGQRPYLIFCLEVQGIQFKCVSHVYLTEKLCRFYLMMSLWGGEAFLRKIGGGYMTISEITLAILSNFFCSFKHWKSFDFCYLQPHSLLITFSQAHFLSKFFVSQRNQKGNCQNVYVNKCLRA